MIYSVSEEALFIQITLVEANSEEEAMDKVKNGEGVIYFDRLDFVDVLTDTMEATEDEHLRKEYNKLMKEENK